MIIIILTALLNVNNVLLVDVSNVHLMENVKLVKTDFKELLMDLTVLKLLVMLLLIVLLLVHPV